MKRKAFAKLNLTLDVVRRREDGFHELDMIMVPIDLFDSIDIQLSESTTIRTNKGYLPNDKRNTIIKAINILRHRYRFKEHFDISLVKNTPTRAGMGGGSSNGACTIRMVNDMLDLNLSEKEMLDVAEQVGSDVPFTLYGRPALVKGVGEKITPIEINLDLHLFVVKPKKGISTPMAFKKLDVNNLEHFDTAKVKKALESGDYQLFLDNIGNSLEKGAFEEVAQIKEAKDDLINFGFDAAIMSGSGSSVFGITQDEQLVNEAVKKFYNKYAFVKKTKIIKDVRNYENINR